MLYAKLTFKAWAGVLQLGRGQEGSWVAYISSSCGCFWKADLWEELLLTTVAPGAWDTQEVTKPFAYSPCHALASKSPLHRLEQPLSSSWWGKGAQGRFVSLYPPYPHSTHTLKVRKGLVLGRTKWNCFFPRSKAMWCQQHPVVQPNTKPSVLAFWHQTLCLPQSHCLCSRFS